MGLNELEIMILQDVIEESMDFRVISNVSYSSWVDVNEDGSFEKLQLTIPCVRDTIEEVGYHCYICGETVNDPVKHLVEEHYGYLTGKAMDYQT